MATLKSTMISHFGTRAAAGALSKGVAPRSFATHSEVNAKSYLSY